MLLEASHKDKRWKQKMTLRDDQTANPPGFSHTGDCGSNPSVRYTKLPISMAESYPTICCTTSPVRWSTTSDQKRPGFVPPVRFGSGSSSQSPSSPESPEYSQLSSFRRGLTSPEPPFSPATPGSIPTACSETDPDRRGGRSSRSPAGWSRWWGSGWAERGWAWRGGGSPSGGGRRSGCCGGRGALGWRDSSATPGFFRWWDCRLSWGR